MHHLPLINVRKSFVGYNITFHHFCPIPGGVLTFLVHAYKRYQHDLVGQMVEISSCYLETTFQLK